MAQVRSICANRARRTTARAAIGSVGSDECDVDRVGQVADADAAGGDVVDG